MTARTLRAGIALALAGLLALSPIALADTLTAKLHGGVEARLLGSNDLGTVVTDFGRPVTVDLASGTGENQADLIFADSRTLTASSTENLDLAGSLASPHGATLTFATVKAIYIKAAAANTNNVVVGGAGSNTFVGPFSDSSDKIAVRPGGVLMISATETGWTVTASTGDILLVANSSSGTSVTYDIIIVGTSA